jgi:hypothetical protein
LNRGAFGAHVGDAGLVGLEVGQVVALELSTLVGQLADGGVDVADRPADHGVLGGPGVLGLVHAELAVGRTSRCSASAPSLTPMP